MMATKARREVAQVRAEVAPAFRRAVKIRASQRGISIRRYLIELMVRDLRMAGFEVTPEEAEYKEISKK